MCHNEDAVSVSTFYLQLQTSDIIAQPPNFCSKFGVSYRNSKRPVNVLNNFWFMCVLFIEWCTFVQTTRISYPKPVTDRGYFVLTFLPNGADHVGQLRHFSLSCRSAIPMYHFLKLTLKNVKTQRKGRGERSGSFCLLF